MNSGSSEQNADLELPQELDTDWVSLHGGTWLKKASKGSLLLDGSATASINACGNAWLCSMEKKCRKAGNSLALKGFSSALKEQLSSLNDLSSGTDDHKRPSIFENAGAMGYWVLRELKAMSYLMSEMVFWNSAGIFKKKTILAGSTTLQMSRLGSSAFPIVVMLSFLIGLTLAFQSAVQLEKFGASLYMVSGIAVSMITEIGPLMTAIILAGRSGSSITAEIASMVVGEEVKALKTMAIHPVHFLVLPRFRALSITGPLLTVCAVIAGIFASFLIASLYLKLPYSLFLSELKWAVTLDFVMQCLIKSVVFSWIIVLVATNRGLWVRGGADAVGMATTSCVVMSISSIILADAIFSFIFYW